MKLEQVSKHCYAVVNEKNRIGDASSGLINRGGGIVIDTQFDLGHARSMIEEFSRVWEREPTRVVNTHEDGDHVWGNQLFEGAEIIGHSSLPERMREVANPEESVKLLKGLRNPVIRLALRLKHPGLLRLAQQLAEDYDFEGIELTLPTTLFDDEHVVDLDGTEARLLHVGPCHQVGDTLVHVPDEGVLFAGDVVFRGCAPMGWVGTYDAWLETLDRIIELAPEVVVPGHGPITDLDGVREMRAYLEFVRTESQACFGRGMTSLQAAKTIDLGPFEGWAAPSRLWMNVERAYREIDEVAPETPWDFETVIDNLVELAESRGLPVEF